MSDAPARTMTGAVLGIDAGSVRVGLAASDPTRTVATPVATVQRRSQEFWSRLMAEIELRRITSVVVGLPRRLDGSEGVAAAEARTLAAEVAERTGLTVALWDERFTTAQAERHLIAANVRRRRRRQTIDAVAATLMLQSWLDSGAGAHRGGADRT